MTAGVGAGAGAEQITLPAREAYRLWAPFYDAENAVTTLERRVVAELTPPLSGVSLLDAACGTARRMPGAGGGGPARVVGVDLVSEMLQAGARKDVCLAAADVRALPCLDASFDVIWCRLAVGHVPDIERVYSELARVARRGAHIIVTDFHPMAACAGHTRSFRDAQGRLHTVEHYIHDLAAHTRVAYDAGLKFSACEEPSVGPEVHTFYEQAGRLDAYQQQQGLPLVLALLLRA